MTRTMRPVQADGSVSFSVLARVVTIVALLAGLAAAEPMIVVVRDGGDAALAITRLRGQLADLEIALRVEPGAIEPALDAQLATAARLAEARDARAVVWFLPRHRGLAVAIATPADHRLFVREIAAGDGSAIAEAAAVAARSALRAISLGGTLGVEVPPPAEERAPPPRPAPRRTGLELAVGWQVALDAGADAGAQAIAQRTSVTRGAWAGSLALTLGPALRHDLDPAVAALSVELSRSSAALGIERRIGTFALAVAAGAVVYHRATVAASGDLASTPAAATTAFVAGPELRWRGHLARHVGIEAAAGLDVVIGAPELVVTRGDEVQVAGRIRAVQPRFVLSVFAGLP
jgi:hypothetical protein